VSDEIPIAPLIYDGLDPAPKPKPVVSEVLDVLGGSVQHSQSPINAEGGAVMEPIWNLKFGTAGQYCSDLQLNSTYSQCYLYEFWLRQRRRRGSRSQ